MINWFKKTAHTPSTDQEPLRIWDGTIWSPFFIFIRSVQAYSDTDLLEIFGLAKYKRTDEPSRRLSYVCITNDEEWTHMVDDWRYTLWHMASTRRVIADIAKEQDVFACSVGECDRSYDFVYYRDGGLARKFVVESPHFSDRVVTDDLGTPLPAETHVNQETDEHKFVLSIASSLGIETRHDRANVRVYHQPKL